MSKVTSLWGQPTGEAKVSEYAVKTLERALDAARSGETIGVIVIETSKDGLAGHSYGGFCNSYSALGAMEAVKAILVAEFHSDD